MKRLLLTIFLLGLLLSACSSTPEMEYYNYSEKAFKDALKSGMPTMLLFSAEWCGPCRAIKSEIKELMTEYKGKANILVANIDTATLEGRKITEVFDVRTIPSFAFFDKMGKHTQTFSGYRGKKATKEILDKLIGS